MPQVGTDFLNNNNNINNNSNAITNIKNNKFITINDYRCITIINILTTMIVKRCEENS